MRRPRRRRAGAAPRPAARGAALRSRRCPRPSRERAGRSERQSDGWLRRGDVNPGQRGDRLQRSPRPSGTPRACVPLQIRGPSLGLPLPVIWFILNVCQNLTSVQMHSEARAMKPAASILCAARSACSVRARRARYRGPAGRACARGRLFAGARSNRALRPRCRRGRYACCACSTSVASPAPSARVSACSGSRRQRACRRSGSQGAALRSARLVSRSSAPCSQRRASRSRGALPPACARAQRLGCAAAQATPSRAEAGSPHLLRERARSKSFAKREQLL